MQSEKLARHSDKRLDRVFHALANSTRRKLLAQLRQGPAHVGELADPIRMSLNAVSKHLFVLEEAGLIRRTRDGQGNICTLSPTPMADAETWIASYRGYWQDTIDRFAAFVEETEKPE